MSPKVQKSFRMQAMKIYIMRHGHAEQHPNADGRRSLTPHGKQALVKFGQFLKTEGVLVSHILHSEKLRAQQTAEIIAAAMAPQMKLEVCKRLNPECDIEPLVAEIEQWSDDTLLVGHMPFVSQLVSELVLAEQTMDLVRFTPGTLICLERYDHDNWLINWSLRPELLA